MPFTTPTLEPSVTSHQMERDGLLDYISHLNDCRERATDYLLTVARDVDPITDFEITEALALLWEAPDVSEARRFARPQEPVVPSTTQDLVKEEQ